MYDDHEIENDWVKGPEDALYVEAMKYYRAFFGIRNPPSPVAGEHYYNFSIGTSSFFVLDSVGSRPSFGIFPLRWRDATEKTRRPMRSRRRSAEEQTRRRAEISSARVAAGSGAALQVHRVERCLEHADGEGEQRRRLAEYVRLRRQHN